MNKNDSMSNNSVQVESNAKEEFMKELTETVTNAVCLGGGCDTCYTPCFTG